MKVGCIYPSRQWIQDQEYSCCDNNQPKLSCDSYEGIGASHVPHWPSSQRAVSAEFFQESKENLEKCGEVENMTVANDDKALLTYDLPEHFSESFQIFDELIKKAEMEPSDIQQVEAYLWVHPTLVKLFLLINPY
jgi:hypothetical protein